MSSFSALTENYYLVLLAIALAEMALSGFWNRFYFTIGIPVFRQQVAVRLSEVPTTDQLTEATKGRWTGPLIFHRFENGEIGFRERALGGGFFHYTPVMHGIIRRHAAEPSVEVVGLLNWFVPVLVIFMIATLGNDALVFVGFLAAVVVLLYLLQRRRFTKVAAALSGKPAG